jgi:acyl-homoserine-lactone acylase
MKKLSLLLILLSSSCSPRAQVDGEVERWQRRAEAVTIVRDDWGIAHIYGPTDADAVFGMMYAQAEDDFNRIEVNFLNSQGRLAEAEGEAEIFRDLRMKLFIDPDDMKAQYAESPEWLRALMDAWADGLNYYLHTHPEVRPRVLTHFEPWMALTFSEGSIGGDIERVDLAELEAFYGQPATTAAAQPGADQSRLRVVGPKASESAIRAVASLAESRGIVQEPVGSNGFAVAPSNTEEGHALLLINPHTSFYFRSELHVVSEEGLNAYGAVTWGQFFVYQGFNETAGWMHTSSGVDNIDEYLETIVETDEGLFYRHGEEVRPLVTRQVTVPYRTATGDMDERVFTVYRTHHGPIVREADGRWVSVALMEAPMNALIQSYTRTKAANYDEFVETMRLHTNSSNNTVFADADGNIAYFHSNFIPVRDPSFDWDRPVDGADPATDWQGVHSLEETVGSLNPSNGWIQNTNNWPYSVSGPTSPLRSDFPSYMQRGGENPRGVHAIRVLEGKTDFTLASLIDAAYDSYLTAFDDLLPALFDAYAQIPAADARKARLREPITALQEWDQRWDVASVPTSLAVFWGETLRDAFRADAEDAGVNVYDYMATRTTTDERLNALVAAVERLEQDFGSWRTPWGEINRFQRLTGDIDHPFDDDAPSIPVGFTSARWGSLASFGARRHDGSKKLYGTSGNSFVAVVQFGDSVRARAITAGGESGDPASPHFNDQAERYSTGDLREVYFYRGQLEGHVEREYHPGG